MANCFNMTKNNKVVPFIEVYTINGTSSVNLTSHEADPKEVIVDKPLPTSNMNRRHSLWWHLAVDVPIALLMIALVTLFELGVLPSHTSGFYCNDPALDFPFIKDTVSTSTIIYTIILLPLILLLSVELILHKQQDYPLKSNRFRESSRTAGIWYRDYIYGAFMNLCAVEVMKNVIGTPRPTFFSICEPDSLKTCNGTQYVPDFKCTSTKYAVWFTSDASKSFPSGHTSLSIYAALFMAWYLQRRAFSWRNHSVLAVPLLQVLCIAYAAWCSLTRLTDHRHHWWDVLAGAIIGLFSGLFTNLILTKNFSCTSSSTSSSDISSDSGGVNHPSVRRLLSSSSGNHTTCVAVP